jgi:hypothetical protein
MFEEFSGSYYLGRLYVRPAEEERARMHEEVHERLNRELYTSGRDVARTDAPLVMKLDNAHFPVVGDDSVPADTLAVPEELVEETPRGPELREVMLAKAGRARQLLRLSGGYTAPDAT